VTFGRLWSTAQAYNRIGAFVYTLPVSRDLDDEEPGSRLI